MLDSKKTSPNCSLAEEIVSYVYDEIEGAERVEFEQHLGSCSVCEKELAAFSLASSSVRKWRDLEFAGLQTPEIVIPYETGKKPLFVNDTNATSASWIENLRGFFSSFGMKTVGAFASLLVVFGFGWFLVNSFSGGSDIAETPKKNNVEPINDKENLNPGKADSNDIAKENESEIVAPAEAAEVTPEIAVDRSPSENVRKTGPTRAAHKPTSVKRQKPIRKNVTKKRSPSKRLKKPGEEPPVIQATIDRLTEEFAIDEKKEDELRLSDLFDEVGSDK